jgi:hypothetical protein
MSECFQKDLGCHISSSGADTSSCVGSGSQMYMYISPEKRVVGFLSAESIRRAQRLRIREPQGDDADDIAELSEKEEAAVCGVSEVWVLPGQRRSGIALRLLEALLTSYAVPSRLDRAAVAFSQPTRAGRLLGAKFFGTEKFLVYRTTV